jgi:hypothetical protein
MVGDKRLGVDTEVVVKKGLCLIYGMENILPTCTYNEHTPFFPTTPAHM